MSGIKFLQISDVHLDRSLAGGRLRLPYEKAQLRRNELRQALEQAVKTAAEEKVQVILIPGDLWEEDELVRDTIPFVMDVLSGFDGEVYIAPGNHDYYAVSTHYSDALTQTRYNRKWPSNVVIFSSRQFSHHNSVKYSGLCVSGLAYHSPMMVSERMLSERQIPPPAEVNLALFHGSLDSRRMRGQRLTMPFSEEELLQQPFAYTALGHYHHRHFIRDKAGRIRAGYSGSPCALRVIEGGEHGCIIGLADGGGVAEESVSFKALDKRKHHRLKVDVSGLDNVNAVLGKVKDSLVEAAVAADDMVMVLLTGGYPAPQELHLSADWAEQACWHLRIITSFLKPVWDIDDDGSGLDMSIESAYRAQVKRLAEKAKAENDTTRANLLTNAFNYGMNALHDMPLQPRDIDQEVEDDD